MSDTLQILFDVSLDTAIIYIGVLAGVIFIKSPLQKHRTQFVNGTINFLTPLLIISSILSVDLESSTLLIPLIGGVLVTVIGIYIPKLLSNVMRVDQPSPAELCTSAFSNALNFPYPIILAFSFGGLGAASIFLVVSIIARNTVGFWISNSKMDWSTLYEILRFPPVWGIVIGFILRLTVQGEAIQLEESIVIQVIFQIGIFATLMTVGFSMQKPKFKYKIPLMRVGTSRFLISGIVAILFIVGLDLTSDIGIPLFVQMIAPPAVYNGLYAEKMGLDTELTSQMIVTLTLLALILLPLELLAIQLYFFS